MRRSEWTAPLWLQHVQYLTARGGERPRACHALDMPPLPRRGIRQKERVWMWKVEAEERTAHQPRASC